MKTTSLLPRLNTNDDEMDIIQWYVPEKQFVNKGDIVACVESSKAAYDIEAEDSGYIKFYCQEKDSLKVDSAMFGLYSTLDELENDQEKVEAYSEPAIKNCAVENKLQDKTEDYPVLLEHAIFSKKEEVELNLPEINSGITIFSNAALQYLKKLNIDKESIQVKGLVTVNDLKKIIENTEKKTGVPHSDPAAVEMAINKEIVRSKAISNSKKREIEQLQGGQAGNINSSLTIQFNSESIRQGLGVFKLPPSEFQSYLLFEFAKLLKEYPEFTAYYKDGAIHYYDQINIGVAIDMDKGLKTPVIHNADKLSAFEIFESIRKYALKYIDNKLSVDDLSKSTITVTDLSGSNILSFQPLILENQAVILGIGGDSKMPGYPMTLTLVFDHRVSSGKMVGQFLAQLKNNLTSIVSASVDAVNEIKQKRNVAATINDLVQKNEARKGSSGGNYKEKLIPELKAIFGNHLNLKPTEIDEDEFLENVLTNSIKITKITSTLLKIFPDLPTTFLFEHKTISTIADYLTENYPAELAVKYGKLEQQESELENFEKQNEQIAPASSVQHTSSSASADIAIIGINGKFPGAATIDEFWNNLVKGKSSIAEIPASRWTEKYYSAEGEPDKSYNKWGGFIDDADKFDAGFFHISPLEAELMDPQQRLFLEVSWGLIEDAGYTRETLDRNTGVFVGIISSDYNIYTSEASKYGASAYRMADYYQVPNRISYYMDLQGPSMAIDTACSASGTSLHIACMSLRAGDCNTAIVGGVNLFFHPSRYIQYCQMQILSKSEHCKPFGNNATGTIYGEGIGAVLLKKLNEAEADGDHIYGLIKGTSINSDGKTNGFTVPNPQAQSKMIAKALKQSNIDARTVSYIEAHGTGTPLGDPIEVRGLTLAFNESSTLTNQLDFNQFCALGSLKSNIGHLESGAAIAGLIKIMLQMKYETLVPSLNATELNPLIAFEKTPFYVNRELKKWERPVLEIDGKMVTYPRTAGLSSFGAGGSNAHIVVQEYMKEQKDEVKERDVVAGLIVLSAQSQEDLETVAGNLLAHINKNRSNIHLTDMSYTLLVGREAMTHRIAFTAQSLQEVQNKLSDFINKRSIESIYIGKIKNHKKINPGEINSLISSELQGIAKLEYYAQQWVAGNPVQWNKLDAGHNAQRISLPTYPFKGERYWIPTIESKNISETDEIAAGSIDELIDLIADNKISPEFAMNQLKKE